MRSSWAYSFKYSFRDDAVVATFREKLIQSSTRQSVITTAIWPTNKRQHIAWAYRTYSSAPTNSCSFQWLRTAEIRTEPTIGGSVCLLDARETERKKGGKRERKQESERTNWWERYWWWEKIWDCIRCDGLRATVMYGTVVQYVENTTSRKENYWMAMQVHAVTLIV